MKGSKSGILLYGVLMALIGGAFNNCAGEYPKGDATTAPASQANEALPETGPKLIQKTIVPVTATGVVFNIPATEEGSTLVVALAVGSGTNNTITSLSDSANTVYVSAGARANYLGGATEIWYAKRVPAGVTSLTVTTAGSSFTAHVYEISGTSEQPLMSVASTSFSVPGVTHSGPQVNRANGKAVGLQIAVVDSAISAVSSPFVVSVDPNGNASAWLADGTAGVLSPTWTLTAFSAFCASSIIMQ
ncbi:MAG: hypothetical protein AB7F86_18825 [Bdellovibrionales bacterium]